MGYHGVLDTSVIDHSLDLNGSPNGLTFTRYLYYQYCMVYDIYREDRGEFIYWAKFAQ